MKDRYEISPLYGSEPYGRRSSLAEAESFAVQCAAHLNLEVCVHDRETGLLRLYDPQRRGWLCREGTRVKPPGPLKGEKRPRRLRPRRGEQRRPLGA
ncbi:MAG: hypothetical protein JO069_04160 [Verrucomicrobia bacterium]|nr:hypothetical protein [Verrucomicrobiota bacterium]